MSISADIELQAVTLPVGDTMRGTCLACGKDHMTITRVSQGLLAYLCHRANCRTAGYVGERYPGFVNSGAREAKPPRLYTDSTWKLETADRLYFSDQFGIPAELSVGNIYWNDKLQYVFPIRGPHGQLRGYQVRIKSWEGAPNKGVDGLGGRMKYDTYMHERDQPLLSWYFGDTSDHLLRDQGPVVLVEDCLSALRIVSDTRAFAAVALLGTNVNADVVREVATVAEGREVLIALDPDAINKALSIARKWGPALPMRVIITTCDPKDDDNLWERLAPTGA